MDKEKNDDYDSVAKTFTHCNEITIVAVRVYRKKPNQEV